MVIKNHKGVLAYPMLKLELTDPEPVKYLSEVLGCSFTSRKLNGKYYKNPADAKTSYCAVTKERFVVTEFLKRVGHYIFNRTRERDVALSFLNAQQNFKYLDLTDEEFLYWITGFFEGDGSITINHNKSLYNVSFTGTNFGLISYIRKRLTEMKLIKFNNIYTIKAKQRWYNSEKTYLINTKECYQLIGSGPHVIKFITTIYPIMKLLRKKNKIKETLLVFNDGDRYNAWLKNPTSRFPHANKIRSYFLGK